MSTSPLPSLLQPHSAPQPNFNDEIDKAIYEDLLMRNVKHLRANELSKVFDDSDSIDILVHIASEFNLSLVEENRIKACQYGGGEPHKIFVQLLRQDDITTDELKEAFEDLDFDIKLIQHLLMNKKYLTDFSPEELAKLADLLIGDIENPIAWKKVGEELTYAMEVHHIEQTQTEDGIYSPTKGLINILGKKNVRICELAKVLRESPYRSACDHFRHVLKDMVKEEKNKRASEGDDGVNMMQDPELTVRTLT